MGHAVFNSTTYNYDLELFAVVGEGFNEIIPFLCNCGNLVDSSKGKALYRELENP